MNRIEAKEVVTRVIPEGYLTIFVDGLPLDYVVDRAYPDGDLTDLVPSLLGWFHREEDGIVPWKRILPGVGRTSVAPILICPDDLDYSCTTVVVEIASEEEEIRWERFGFDASPPGELVCTWIRWIPGAGPFRFRREEYERCLAQFRSSSTRDMLERG